MERRWNLASVMVFALLLLTSFAFAANTGPNTNPVPGKKFCVKAGGTDGMVLSLSQQSSSYVPTTEPSTDGGPEIVEKCYDLWYDETAVHSQGVYPDAYSYLTSALSGAHGALDLLTDIDFGGTNGDGSCTITFRPLPDDNGNGFYGHGHTIKNLCLKLDGIPSDYISEYSSDDVMGVGFFSTISGMYVDSVNFDNVDIEIKNDYKNGYSGLVVQAGAAVGIVNGSGRNFKNISMKNVKIVAAQAGGLVGATAGSDAVFRDISGENVEVYANTDALPSSVDEVWYNGQGEKQWKLGVAIGGLVGVIARGGTIVDVGISGLNVHSSADNIGLLPQNEDEPDGKTLAEQSIGGIVGRADGIDEQTNYEINIVNTYTVGDISMPDDKYNSLCKVGFLAGTLNLAGGTSYSTIGVNYHYGEDDYLASALAGYMAEDDDDITGQWATKNFGNSYTHSYRNAINVSIPEGECIFSADYMKTDEFAYTLNSLMHFTPPNAQTTLAGTYKTSEWSRKSGVNEGLPVFANESLKPIYQVTFTVEGTTFDNMSSADKQKMKSAGAADLLDPDQEVPVVIGSKMTLYTNYAGKLTNTTWATTATQIAGTAYNWNYQDASGRILPFAIKTSAVYDSDLDLSLTEKRTVKVYYGFVESGNGDWFTPVEGFAERLNADPYFMGNPVSEITSDSVWARVPYLATYKYNNQTDEWTYEYYEFSLKRKSDCHEEDWGYDEPVEICFFVEVSTTGSGKFLTDALSDLPDGEDLYVVYSEFSTTFDPSASTSAPGGYMFVADLHGNDVAQGKANVQVEGIDGLGQQELFGAPGKIPVRTEALANVGEALSRLSSTVMKNVPYSPYVTVDYPSTAWESVDDVVALVVVGEVGASSADDWVVGVAGALADTRTEDRLPKDTVTALESPEKILNEIRANQSEPVHYVRYLAVDKDGRLDLTNLFAALELVKDPSLSYQYPVFVGFLPRTKTVTYQVTFDFDMQDKSSFYVANRWLEEDPFPKRTYTKENASGAFIGDNGIGLFSLDACSQRLWSFVPESNRFSSDTLFDGIYGMEKLLEAHERVYGVPPYIQNKDGSRSLTVYAVWQRDPSGCTGWPNRTRMEGNQNQVLVWNNAVIEDKSSLGNVVLQQKWRGDTLRHVSTSLNEGVTGMYVPYADSLDYVFEVYADGYPGYEVDGDILFSKQGEYDDEPTTIKLKEGDTLRLGGFGLTDYTMWFSADYTYKKFTIQFVTGKADVFYGENSDSVGVYKLEDEEDSIDLPFWVYTEDNCVEGWKVYSELALDDESEKIHPREQEDGSDADWNPDCEGDPNCEHDRPDNWAVAFEAFNFALSDELDRQNGKRLERYPLYASWTDAQTCVKELGYKQTRLTVAENGVVAFKELKRDSTGKVINSQVHEFAKDSTMLLPYYVKGSDFVVVGMPAKGFILDSLVMTLDGKKYVYHEGDTLTGSIAKATFAAYFMPENPTPAEFAEADLYQSGSAIQFRFTTTEFNASGASVKIVLEDDDGEVVKDTVLAVTKTPYTDSWDYYPLRAGTYLLTATVANSKTSDVFEQDFEVKSTIVAKEDGWQMLSLSNVVMDSVTWDNDIRFYWWDDTKSYGTFWHYQRLMDEDEIDNLTGYWYSSMKGRPLVMRSEMKAPKGPVVWNLDSVYTGWNMVANPYGWAVDLYGENQDKKKSATEKPDVEFWSWNDSTGSYEEVDVVGPYAAVWAKVKGSSQWKLPAKPTFVSKVDEDGNDSLVEPLKKTVELASNHKGWAIRAVLRDAKGKRDGWNIMGVAESGWNAEEPPAGMGDRVNLSIKEGNKSLAKSFKTASGDSYEWTVSLDASGDRPGYLHFEGIENLSAAGLKVFVTVDGTTTQMAENDTLKVAIGSLAKTATVRVAPSARTIVAQKLNGLRAFQAGNSLQVGFQASESLAGAKAYVEILDMKGKVLSSTSGTAVSGSNAMTLQAPRSGLYMVRVRVGSKQAAGSVAIK